MEFNRPVEYGTIHKRYKRFLADVELENGDIVIAHVANTGSMKTCWEPGQQVLMTFHDDPKRKLKYSIELIHNGLTWIGVNTARPNAIVIEALKNKKIIELADFTHVFPEVKVGKSRIDILLKKESGKQCYLEVKNATFKGDLGQVLFPDAITTRGQKHLRELTKIVEDGGRAVMFYLVNRSDITHFEVASDIDPEYARLLKKAIQVGVEILVYGTIHREQGIILGNKIHYQI